MASGGNGRHMDFDFSDLGDDLPEHFKKGIKDLGTLEYVGPKSKKKPNPRVEGWIADIGGKRMNSITTPWCAYWIGHCLKEAGHPHTGSGMARSYLKWGKPVELSEAEPGDIIVSWRGKYDDGVTGHVTMFVKQEGDTIYGLGGNQGDAVCVQEFTDSKILGVRRLKSWTASRTVKAAVGSAISKAAEKVADVSLPDPEPIQAAVGQAKGALGPLASSKPYIIGILAVLSIALALYAAWYRISDHKQGKNS
jgi:uncharacterized protein (TIGR02594 family)